MRDNRKLLFWGCGKIGRQIIELYPECRPSLIVDGAGTLDSYYDIPVVMPQNVASWESYFVVITVNNTTDIEAYLRDQGLESEADFTTYQNYFSIAKQTFQESLESVERLVDDSKRYVGKNLLLAPLYNARDAKTIHDFFVAFVESLGKENCLILNMPSAVNNDRVKQDFGCEVISICQEIRFREQNAQSYHASYDVVDDVRKSSSCEYANILAEIKKSNPATRFASEMTYRYLDRLLELLKPTKIFWWGFWGFDCFIIRECCAKRNIPIVFMEHGWLPGTVQFNRGGIASESVEEFANDSLQDGTVAMQIKEYIVSSGKDTYRFKNSAADQEKLAKLDSSKKTIFLVGMDDYGMAIIPNSSYWKEKISSVVSGSKDAYNKLKQICEARDWNLIYKPHPAIISGEQHEYEESNRSIVVYDTDVNVLIEKADAAVSIMSAVDFKVLLLDKPLVQIGKGAATKSNATYVVTCAENLEEQLETAVTNGFTSEQKVLFERHMMSLLHTTHFDDRGGRSLRYGREL